MPVSRRKTEISEDSGVFDGKSFRFTEARAKRVRDVVVSGSLETDDYGRRSWRDDGMTGLVLTVNGRSGTATWSFVAKVSGRAVRHSLGDIDLVSLEEARDAVGRLRHDKTTAGVLAPKAAKEGEEKKSMKLGTVVSKMLDDHRAGRWLPGRRRRQGPPTDRTMSFYVDLHHATTKEYDGMTLVEFAEALPEIYAKLQARAAVQANRSVQLWRNIFGYAIDAGFWSGGNPAADTGGTARLTKTPELPRQRVLSDAEWKRLDKAMAADDSLWRDLFTLSIRSLQRMGACCRARWDDITLTGKHASWRIPASDMKGRAGGHVVPLAGMPDLLAILTARRKLVSKDCPWVFPAIDGEGHVTTYKTAWRRILDRAKLHSEDRNRRPRPHDLRRTGGSRMVSAGVPLNVVTKALGDSQSSVGMVAKTYAVVVDDALAEAYAATPKRTRR